MRKANEIFKNEENKRIISHNYQEHSRKPSHKKFELLDDQVTD